MVERRDSPQLFAWTEDIFHAFFYLQHEQSYHTANKGNFHLSRNRRKLHPDWKSKHISNKHHKNTTRTERGNCVPGAFSHMSHRGTSLGLARPTLTCLLASLLHMWTCKLQKINLRPIGWNMLTRTTNNKLK